MSFLFSFLLLSLIDRSVSQSDCVHTGAIIANSVNCICGNGDIQTELGTSLIPTCTKDKPYCYKTNTEDDGELISSCSSRQGYYYAAITQDDCETSDGLTIQTPAYCREAFNNGYNAPDRGAYCIDGASDEDPSNDACKTGTVSQKPSFSQTEQPGCYIDRYVGARGIPPDLPLDILILNQNFESSAAYTATKVGLCQMPVGCSDTTGLFPNTEQCQCGSNFCLDDKLVCSPPGASCSPETTNAACSAISGPNNQAKCDPKSIGTCAGGSGTQCTGVSAGPEATCIGTNDDKNVACKWTSTNLCTYSGGNVCGCRAGQYLQQSVGTCAGGSGTDCTGITDGPEATCTGTDNGEKNVCTWTKKAPESCEDCTGTDFSQAGTTTPGSMSRACNHNALRDSKAGSDGTTMDTPCPAGTRIDMNNNACLGCPVGWYSDKPGMYVCKQCASGGSSPAGSTRSSDCSGCTLGYGYSSDPATCTVCGAGHYSDQIGNAVCKKCSAGQFLSDARTNPTYPSKHDNEDDCAKCQQGTISDKDGGSAFCNACEVGQKQTDIDPTLFKYKCEACTAGRYQGASGSKICDPCPSGYSQPSTEGIGFCIPCGAGFYTDQEGLATCKDCAVGKAVRYSRSAPNVVCADCHTGTYQDQTGKSSCKNCLPGKIVAATSGLHIACTDCVVGKIILEAGQTACIDCHTGTYQNQAGRSSCKNCSPGKHIVATGQIECKECVVGKVSRRPGSACIDCNTGTYQDNPGESSCENCRPGQIMPATSGLQIACTNCIAGKYQSSSKQAVCMDCPEGYFTGMDINNAALTKQAFCLPCPSGTYAEQLGQSSKCKTCDEGFFRALPAGTSCDQCGVGETTTIKGATICDKW